MSKGINKVILIGNLGNDPDSRSFPDGSAVTNISVATSESWTDKQTGQQQEKTEWCRVVLRDRGNYRLGQIAQQYLRKGSKVYIEGSLRTRKYTDSQGQERYITEIIADQMQMLDSRQAGQQGGYDDYGQQPYQAPAQQPYQQQAPAYQQVPAAMGHQQAPAAPYPPAQAHAPAAPEPAQSQPPMVGNEFDGDIPF